MMVTENDWAELEAGDLGHGMVSRRILPRSGQDIFIAVQRPTLLRMLLLRLPASVAEAYVRRTGNLPQTRGLLMSFTAASDGTRDLQLVLNADDRREVFNPLIADVAAAAGQTTTAEAALRAAVERFEHWRDLLQSIAGTGMSPEARRGLFGELTVLRGHILPLVGPSAAVQAWTGPNGAHQDFQLPTAALEVKASSGQRSGTIIIANEQQLDDTGTDRLVLAHLALDERQGGTGESLNSLIASLRTQLPVGASSVLDDQLARVGYLRTDRALYEEPRYTVREVRFWHVTGTFPRIVENDLRPGVAQCRYRISTVGLDQYIVPPGHLADFLKEGL